MSKANRGYAARVAGSTIVKHTSPTRSPSPVARARRSRRAAAVAWLTVCAAACTLTAEDYEPALVDQGALGSEPETAPTPEPPAPPAPPCGEGVECCEALPCTGEASCVGGRCTAASTEPPPCSGSDCAGEPVPLAPSCDDGAQNGDETGVDCGGSCEASCQAGAGCRSDEDCGQGASCAGERCVEAACDDGAQNGDESAQDCGGSCPPCGDGATCRAGADCSSAVCGEDGTCAAPSCEDARRNGAETDVDCGGECPPCGDGARCEVAAECQSGVCAAEGCGLEGATCCQSPSCSDGVRNGGEPVVDCGNAACGLCEVGRACTLGAQCETGVCAAGRCQNAPSCNDGLLNGNETGVDCGGGTCGRCPDLQPCTQPSDCANNNCDFRGICISCGDGVQNGTETDIDCGGADPFCRRCSPGERCFQNPDCVFGFCLGGFC